MAIIQSIERHLLWKIFHMMHIREGRRRRIHTSREGPWHIHGTYEEVCDWRDTTAPLFFFDFFSPHINGEGVVWERRDSRNCLLSIPHSPWRSVILVFHMIVHIPERRQYSPWHIHGTRTENMLILWLTWQSFTLLLRLISSRDKCGQSCEREARREAVQSSTEQTRIPMAYTWYT